MKYFLLSDDLKKGGQQELAFNSEGPLDWNVQESICILLQWPLQDLLMGIGHISLLLHPNPGGQIDIHLKHQEEETKKIKVDNLNSPSSHNVDIVSPALSRHHCVIHWAQNQPNRWF